MTVAGVNSVLFVYQCLSAGSRSAARWASERSSSRPSSYSQKRARDDTRQTDSERSTLGSYCNSQRCSSPHEPNTWQSDRKIHAYTKWSRSFSCDVFINVWQWACSVSHVLLVKLMLCRYVRTQSGILLPAFADHSGSAVKTGLRKDRPHVFQYQNRERESLNRDASLETHDSTFTALIQVNQLSISTLTDLYKITSLTWEEDFSQINAHESYSLYFYATVL